MEGFSGARRCSLTGRNDDRWVRTYRTAINSAPPVNRKGKEMTDTTPTLNLLDRPEIPDDVKNLLRVIPGQEQTALSPPRNGAFCWANDGAVPSPVGHRRRPLFW